jgi:hypothetical protein
MIEPLEQRNHLSATLTGNVLTIVGTARSDDIAIAAGRETFVVHDNGVQTAFATRQVRTIRIFGLAGDDSIIVSPRLTIRCSIEAGTGNDRVGGGAENDTIFGARGNDTLVGNGGNDYIDAGADDDLIEDYTGVNVIHGGAGNDVAYVDPYRLGTGVESKQQVGRIDGLRAQGETEILREDGRLILRYAGYLSGLNDTDEQFGPEALPNGQFLISSKITLSAASTGNVGSFNHRWDITDQIDSGIVFTKTFADEAETYPGPPSFQTLFSLSLFLPAK